MHRDSWVIFLGPLHKLFIIRYIYSAMLPAVADNWGNNILSFAMIF